ncbi:hypothetical protein K504DRAFT_502129 [Pleomassaria siparia CBS 279.74]|uniref:Uncharacterized protein n=1 Tax=Pleomassaria siparia CBS 279.74 TaxID=1314801 RepID=A0A6G1KAA8_9PLEO|nr:hypothetical protein K504DRAFT_502129 [Pleomassaria siparia CBS 279.74]
MNTHVPSNATREQQIPNDAHGLHADSIFDDNMFCFEKNRKQVLDTIYLWPHSLMVKIAQLNHQENGDTPQLRHTTFCICPAVSAKLVAQLFTTLFYAEIDDPVEDSAGAEMLIPVRIYCRLLDFTPEIHHVGRLLKFGTFRNSDFAFWEEGYDSQQFPVVSQTLDAMIYKHWFTMFRLLIPLCSRTHLDPQHRPHIERPQTPKIPSWSATKDHDVPSLGVLSLAISLGSLTLNDVVPSHRGIALSDQPGPAEIEGEAPPYEEDDDYNATILPQYNRQYHHDISSPQWEPKWLLTYYLFI